ncbi:MAG TPA: hypothetical protein VGI00_23990 [Streptosporangiaceae bacterium]
MTTPVPETASTLLVMAKQPVPGRVKTRLVPPCTYEQAAALAEAALADTLHTLLTVPARRRILVLDGRPGPWLPPGFDVVPQCGGLLDVDTAADAVAVARQAPRSRFAARARALAAVLSAGPDLGETA